MGDGAAMEDLEPSGMSTGAQPSALSYHLSVGGASSSSRGRGEQQQVHSSGSPEWEECFMVSFDVNLWEWKERKDLICLQTREGLDLEGRSVGRCAAGVTLPLRTDWNVFLMQDSNTQPGAPPRSLIVTSNKQIHQRLSSQAERSATAMFFADEFNATFNPRFPVKFQEFMAVQVPPLPRSTCDMPPDLNRSLSTPSPQSNCETIPGDAIHQLLHDPAAAAPYNCPGLPLMLVTCAFAAVGQARHTSRIRNGLGAG
jgi:hypothetical protein